MTAMKRVTVKSYQRKQYWQKESALGRLVTIKMTPEKTTMGDMNIVKKTELEETEI